MEGEPELGARIDRRFVLTKKLGAGAFGAVWLAEDQQHPDRPVALKLLHADHRKKAWVLERFQREAAILEKLRHPNVARAIAFRAGGERPYLALEFVEGTTLEDHLLALGEQSLPIADALALLEGLSSAVDAAHRQSVVHRDLKPRNVMVGRGVGAERIKVLDFGVAKILNEPGADATTVGRLLGSLLYLSPEQVKGGAVDGRADLFALSTIAFELLTQRRTWAHGEDQRPLRIGAGAVRKDPRNNAVSILRRIAIEPRPIASALLPSLGPAIDRVFLRGLAIDPAERFGSAAELIAAIRDALAPDPSGARARLGGPSEPSPFAGEPPPLPDTVVMPRELRDPDEAHLVTDTPIVPSPSPPPVREEIPAPAPRANPPGTMRAVIRGLGLVGLAGILITLALRLGSGLEPRPARAPVEEPPAAPRAIAAPAAAVTAPPPPPPPPATPPAPAKAPALKEPPRRASSPVRKSEPTHAAPAPPPSNTPPPNALVERLERLKKNPTDLALLNELGLEIQRAADRLPPGPARSTIRRRAAESMMVGDVGGLERCVQQLTEVTR